MIFEKRLYWKKEDEENIPKPVDVEELADN